MKHLVLLLVLSHITACDTASKAEPYAEHTPEETARIALDAKDFPEAIRLYKDLIAGAPENYENYRFLATAYAEEGGFDIVEAISGTLSESSGNMLDSLSAFLPADPTAEQVASLGLAKDTLLLLPAEHRSFEHPEIETSSSAAQQLQFYQSAYSLIYLKQFTQVTETGALDPARLEEMTDADVDNILNNFEAIAEAEGGGAVAEGVEEFISQLDAAPGGTRREKLLAYLDANPPALTR